MATPDEYAAATWPYTFASPDVAGWENIRLPASTWVADGRIFAQGAWNDTQTLLGTVGELSGLLEGLIIRVRTLEEQVAKVAAALEGGVTPVAAAVAQATLDAMAERLGA